MTGSVAKLISTWYVTTALLLFWFYELKAVVWTLLKILAGKDVTF